MNPAEPPSPGTAVSHHLVSAAPLFDATWKLGVVLSVVLYGIGLTISNFNAQRFGRTDLELLRAEYVSVGLLWSVLVVFGCAMYRFMDLPRLVGFFEDYPPQFPRITNPVKYILRGLLSVIACAGVFSQALFYSGLVLDDPYDWTSSKLWIMFGVTIATGGIVDNIISYGKPFFTSTIFPSSERQKRFDLFYFTLRISLLVGMIGFYAFGVFPDLPSAMGGGSMAQAELFVKSDAYAMFVAQHVTPGADGTIGLWEIVSEQSDAFVITDNGAVGKVSPPRKTIWLPKSSISMLVYQQFLKRPAPPVPTPPPPEPPAIH